MVFNTFGGMEFQEGEDDDTPYSAITKRPPLEDISTSAPAQPEMPMPPPAQQVKDMISKRVAPAAPDPLLADLRKREKEGDAFRQAQIQSNSASNFGQAIAQAARGANTPLPDTGLYNNIERQNASLLKSKTDDQDRRMRVMAAIEGRKNALANKGNTDINKLPAEDQEVVKDLAKKDANKISISNQINAVMDNWDKLSSDQKVSQGRQLLKVLNSTEGQDAIGAEEAKRLGGKLEFAMGNFFNSNPTQFGRDLPGFKEQAMNTSKGLRTAVDSNEAEIGRRYRNAGVERAMPSPAASPSGGKVRVSNGKETFSIDPSDLADAEKDGFKRI